MTVSELKLELEEMFKLLKSNGIEEAPGVLYVAQGCLNNMGLYALQIKFNADLFLGKLWLTAHEAIRTSNTSHVIPIEIITKAPKPGWDIHVTLHKVKQSVNDMKIRQLISENKTLKAELQAYKSSALHRIIRLLAA